MNVAFLLKHTKFSWDQLTLIQEIFHYTETINSHVNYGHDREYSIGIACWVHRRLKQNMNKNQASICQVIYLIKTALFRTAVWLAQTVLSDLSFASRWWKAKTCWKQWRHNRMSWAIISGNKVKSYTPDELVKHVCVCVCVCARTFKRMGKWIMKQHHQKQYIKKTYFY